MLLDRMKGTELRTERPGAQEVSIRIGKSKRMVACEEQNRLMNQNGGRCGVENIGSAVFLA